MAQIIELQDYFEEPDTAGMDKKELLSYLKTLRTRVEALDEQEPKNMNSEAYETWVDRHDELEDLIDEVLDRLDELA